MDALGLVLDQEQLQVRIGLAQARQRFRQHERRDRGDYAQPQFARQRVFLLAGEIDERFDVHQDQAGLNRHLLAHLGNRHLPVGPIHQLRIEQRFQLADRRAEGGLGHEAGSRGLAEVLVFV